MLDLILTGNERARVRDAIKTATVDYETRIAAAEQEGGRERAHAMRGLLLDLRSAEEKLRAAGL